MRIAVTGANGYVGSALCQYLLDQGLKVTALIRQHRQSTSPELVNNHLRLEKVDYQAPSSLVRALTGADAVIHLIAKTHAKDALSEIDEYRATNLGISQVVAQAAAQAGVKRLVFLSSIKVNGEHTGPTPFRNSDQPAPTTAYGISKLEAEQALAQCCQNQLELVILRPPLIYSADAKGNISALKNAILRGWPLPLARIDNKRSIIDLNLLCDYLYKSCITAEANGKTLLISNHHPASTPELVQRIGTDIARQPLLLPVPTPLLKVASKLLGKQEQFTKLCGNLEIDPTETEHLLQPNTDSPQPHSTHKPTNLSQLKSSPDQAQTKPQDTSFQP
ncbi:NAD-dependent epimerase/dehydratase family protein [Aestuariicella hydrocarbonica]|uniref:NAD-dependent epimerase/dehydratase family protein n=1 Tax=Pseudomaricurvus hydrocarbonicus TaxID=1470433 RepID=A0A9E5MGB7_9GAMM|nr:NAD-dependent epimerase/dehydratase family protein [Aestuariicella hydrocarbonica]NHO64461.1 NAD-dependent epimerase/dehydratase family protein [Aestuariicella hydrocarbonica]